MRTSSLFVCLGLWSRDPLSRTINPHNQIFAVLCVPPFIFRPKTQNCPLLKSSDRIEGGVMREQEQQQQQQQKQ